MSGEIIRGAKFVTSFRNVNLKARSTKDGMVYKFESEITEEDWDSLRGVDLTGSLFEANLECVEVAEKKLPEQRKPGGPLSKSAAQMCENVVFQNFMRSQYPDDLAWGFRNGNSASEVTAVFLRKGCGVESRAELDHKPEAAKRFHEIMRRFNSWAQ